MKTLIVGYFGFGLLGDEAILTSLVDDLVVTFHGIEIVVTSINPERTQVEQGVQAISIQKTSLIVEEIHKSDFVILGGGGCFNEYTKWSNDIESAKGIDYNVLCCLVAKISKALKKNFYICGVGIEPLYSQEAISDVKEALQVATIVTVRDNSSSERAGKILSNNETATVTACPAIRLKPTPTFNKNLLESKRKNGLFTIGISLRHWNFTNLGDDTEPLGWDVIIASDLRKIADRFPCKFKFLPFQSEVELGHLGNDVPIIKKMIKDANIEEISEIVQVGVNAKAMRDQIGSCDLVIACRYHSAILSINAGVPFITLSYSDKTTSAAKMVNLEEYAVDLASVKIGDILGRFSSMILNLEELTLKVRHQSQLLKSTALENMNKITEHLSENILEENQESDSLTFLLIKSFFQKLESEFETELYKVLLYDEINKMFLEPKNCHRILEICENIPHLTMTDGRFLYSETLAKQTLGLQLNSLESKYRMAMRLGMDSFWCYYHLGYLQQILGKNFKAIYFWSKAIAINPDSSFAMQLKREIRERLLGILVRKLYK